MATKRRPKGSGSIRQERSGRWRARYRDPDGNPRSAPITFDAREDAEAWLGEELRRIANKTWRPPAVDVTVADYFETYISARPNLGDKTVDDYRSLWRNHLSAPFGGLTVNSLTPSTIRNWFASSTATPHRRAAAYSLMKALCNDAVRDELLEGNPCRVRDGGSRPRRKAVPIITPAQARSLAAAMPPRLAATVVLGSTGALRMGEIFALERGDIEDDDGQVRVHVRRAVKRSSGRKEVGTTKSEAGVRSVALYGSAAEAIRQHLIEHVGTDPHALLFEAARGGVLSPSSFYDAWYPARTACGLPTLKFHALRHAGLTWLGQEGASIPDLQARAGHSSPAAAVIYQGRAQALDRDAELARRLAARADAAE